MGLLLPLEPGHVDLERRARARDRRHRRARVRARRTRRGHAHRRVRSRRGPSSRCSSSNRGSAAPGFIAPGAFRAYGSNAFSIAGGMLIHPNRVLGDLLDEDNVRLIIGLLAPLLFLPVLAPRYLIPAMGLDRAVPRGRRGRARQRRPTSSVCRSPCSRSSPRPSRSTAWVECRSTRSSSTGACSSRSPWRPSASSASTRSTRPTNGRGSGGGRTPPTRLATMRWSWSATTASVRASPEVLPLVAERRSRLRARVTGPTRPSATARRRRR